MSLNFMKAILRSDVPKTVILLSEEMLKLFSFFASSFCILYKTNIIKNKFIGYNYIFNLNLIKK